MQLSIDELKGEIQAALESSTPLADILVLIGKDRLNHFNYIMSMNTVPDSDVYSQGYDVGYNLGFDKGYQSGYDELKERIRDRIDEIIK